VLELAQRLTDGDPRLVLQLAGDALLDQPFAVGETADRDRLAQKVDDLLAPRAALLRPRTAVATASAPPVALDGLDLRRVRLLRSKPLLTISRWLTIRRARPSVHADLRITNIQTTAVRVPLREPLKWTGGTRESASGLILEIEIDGGPEHGGIVGGRRGARADVAGDPGRSSTASCASSSSARTPLRTEWLLHRMEEYSTPTGPRSRHTP